MTTIQFILLILVAAVAGMGSVLDEAQFHRPLVACTLVGLVLGERGNANATMDRPGSQGQGKMLLGLQLRAVGSDDAKALGMSKAEGLLITGVERGKPAAEAGLVSGDVILSANLVPVNSVADLQKVIKEDAEKKGAVMLRVFRRGQVFFRTLTLGK